MKRLFLFFLMNFLLTSYRAFAIAENTESLNPPLEEICSPTECYKVTKELGEGEFGKVYAVENSQGLPFAIKCYKSHFDKKFSELLGDAEREFQRGQLLNHPHIIKSFDLFTYQSPSGEWMKNLVLNLVKGQTIHKTKKGALTYEESLAAARQLLDALHYAFNLDLMHLDLHNSNVMLNDDSDIMVIDLASFYSFEEIFNFVEEESKEKKEKYKELKSSNSPSKTLNMVISERKSALLQIESRRAEKLRKFFIQNPQLFKAIQRFQNEQYIATPSDTATKLKITSKKQSHQKESEIKKSSANTSPAHHLDPSFFQSHYFDRISEMCFNIISKSNLSREEKINLRVEIKKIVWNYQEDIEEGKPSPFNCYIDELIKTLQSTES